MKKTITTLFLLAMSLSTLCASDLLSHIDTAIYDDLALWMNSDIRNRELLDKMKVYETALSEVESSWWSLSRQSQIALVQGQMFYELGEKKESLIQLEKSLELARESNGLRERSDNWRIMSEASSLIMLQKGMIYIMANFSVAQDQANKALELDASNIRASLVIAQFLCSAPPIAGGDLTEGLAIMDSLLHRNDLSELNRFAILRSMSEIYIKEKRWSDAEKYCTKALAIYPGNRVCLDMMTKIQRKL